VGWARSEQQIYCNQLKMKLLTAFNDEDLVCREEIHAEIQPLTVD
jgi:hypothetical protein